MKNKNWKQALSHSGLILLLLTLVASMILTASAAPLPWELSGDEVTLTHGDETYTAFALPIDFRLRPRAMYSYAETVDIFSYYNPNPCSYAAGGGIVWLNVGDTVVYLNSEGRDMLFIPLYSWLSISKSMGAALSIIANFCDIRALSFPSVSFCFTEGVSFES